MTAEATQELNPQDVRTGATIKALREAYGLKREEMARALGKSRRYLQYVEEGERPASRVLCRQIADVLRIPLAAITIPGYEDLRCREGAADSPDAA
jgi:transcriptional regulator with XRE-family HTH domain